MLGEAAFIEAYDLYADAIFRYCFFKTKDRELSKELMQETFTKTWVYLQSGKEVKNLRAFLYRVAHNTAMTELSRAKQQSLDLLKETVGYDPTDEQTVSPEESAEHAIMLRYVDELDPKSREAIVLRYMSGLPVSEIAEMLGESANVISVRIHRALKVLKEKMQLP